MKQFYKEKLNQKIKIDYKKIKKSDEINNKCILIW